MSRAEKLVGLAAERDIDAESIKAVFRNWPLPSLRVGIRNSAAKNEVLKCALAASRFEFVGGTLIHVPETDT